ncbi:actinodefensin-associated protein B [Nocardia transvalensis]|uniref:actinodefensin-associated protein B n=1 Tax=Nocardia transvalensis TaxID=37333 RepID=UPI003A5CAB3C
MADHVRLHRLPFGGCVLVDLSDASCHEIVDAAADLLTVGRLPTDATDEERQFVAHCIAANWIRLEPSITDAPHTPERE